MKELSQAMLDAGAGMVCLDCGTVLRSLDEDCKCSDERVVADITTEETA